jgi:hypothetical protein
VMCQMQGAGCEVHGTKSEVRGTRHRIRDTWYVVRVTLDGSVGRAHAKKEIMYITWEPAGSKPPCHKGAGGGCIPLAPILHKNGMSSAL